VSEETKPLTDDELAETQTMTNKERTEALNAAIRTKFARLPDETLDRILDDTAKPWTYEHVSRPLVVTGQDTSRCEYGAESFAPVDLRQVILAVLGTCVVAGILLLVVVWEAIR